MAKNEYGFILKRYQQPSYYREVFGNYNAVYVSQMGTKIMIVAVPHFLCSEKLGANIDHYDILRQDADCRRMLACDIKSQKKAIEKLERFLLKY